MRLPHHFRSDVPMSLPRFVEGLHKEFLETVHFRPERVANGEDPRSGGCRYVEGKKIFMVGNST